MFSIVIVILVLFLSYLYWNRRDSRLPPGPKGVPLLGTLPFMTKFPPKQLQKWGKEYGGIYTWRCGRDDIVVLTDYDIVNELFIKQGEKMTTRPPLYIFDLARRGYGLIFAKPSIWAHQRSFVASTLRKFLAEKKLIQLITDEAGYLQECIHNTSGELVDPTEFFWYSMINVALSFIASRRFNFYDKKLHEIGEALSIGFDKDAEETFLLYNFPFLRYFPRFARLEKEFVEKNNLLHDVFKEIFREHEESYDENDIRDIMDAFIAEMRKPGSHESFSEHQMSVLATDLMDGGSHSTANILRWLMVALLRYPEYYSKVREEIDTVVGENCTPTASHRERMPFTVAFISEVMRRCTMFASSHVSATKDVEAAGFKLPKDTSIATSMWSIHHDPRYFEDPFKFLPERFIDHKDGKYIKPRYFIPFSVGRRNCVGDNVAHLELFVFLVSILQRFDPKVDDLSTLPNFDDGKCGVIYIAPPFKLRFTERI